MSHSNCTAQARSRAQSCYLARLACPRLRVPCPAPQGDREGEKVRVGTKRGNVCCRIESRAKNINNVKYKAKINKYVQANRCQEGRGSAPKLSTYLNPRGTFRALTGAFFFLLCFKDPLFLPSAPSGIVLGGRLANFNCHLVSPGKRILMENYLGRVGLWACLWGLS